MAKGGAGSGHRRRHRGAERKSGPNSNPLAGASGRDARRNAANQLRSQKRQQALSAHRAASGLSAAPKVIALVAASADADVAGVEPLSKPTPSPPPPMAPPWPQTRRAHG